MKWLQNIFLTIIAALALYFVGKWLLAGSIVVCIFQSVRKLKKDPLADMFFELACAIDEVGNVIAGPLFNLICFKFSADIKYFFGSRKHTLSMIIGANWDNINGLTKFISYVLVELWDKGHFERAAISFHKINGTYGGTSST